MMGMGEPLLNFDNVVRAMSLMRDDLGFGLANKRVTLSTAGLVPMIDKLSEVSDVSLAVSLHAPNDELRTRTGAAQQEVPDRRTDGRLRALRAAQAAHLDHLRIHDDEGRQRPARARPRSWRKLMRKFDAQVQSEDAAKVNLIPFNPFPGTRFERSDEADIRAFQKILLDSQVLTMVRRTRGDDIDAACGQLKGQVMDRTRRQAEFNRKLASTGNFRCGGLNSRWW